MGNQSEAADILEEMADENPPADSPEPLQDSSMTVTDNDGNVVQLDEGEENIITKDA